MNYIIEKVMVGQIVVQFADESRAVVAISTTHTPEEIDHLVSFYDPDFKPAPQTAVNEMISVGEERSSVKMEEIPEPESEAGDESTVLSNLLDNGYTLAGALYFQSQGDSSVIEALNDYYATLINLNGEPTGLSSALVQNISDQKQVLVNASNASAEGEEIFNQALEELSDG